MKYTKEQILAAGELGEVSMHDVRHVVSLLDEVVETTRQKIEPDMLIRNGFKKNRVDEKYWKDFDDGTNYIILTPMPDGFYPTFVQLPELPRTEQQIIKLSKIQYWHELEDLVFVLTREELVG